MKNSGKNSRNILAIGAIITAITIGILLIGCALYPVFVDETAAEEISIELPIFTSKERVDDPLGETIDTTQKDNGVVKAHYVSDKKLKLQIIKDGQEYNYPMESGELIAAPLNMGSGKYDIRIMENYPAEGDTAYIAVEKKTITVSLDETTPFLQSNSLCDFAQTDACIQMASYLTEGMTDDAEKADAIINWVRENITYDKSKVKDLERSYDYIPNPSETYDIQSGICFDFSSLTGAMLRSQGIPTKIAVGMHKGDVYHSWNEILIDGKWITVDTTIKHSTPYADTSLYDVQKVY